MKVIKTEIDGVYVVEPQVFGDERGWFMESYSKARLPEIQADFVQDNHSYSSKKGVLRGIHFQNGEHAQAKLVRVCRGAVLDVAVDLRKGSPTYKKWVAVELSAENKKQFFIPKNFAHGFFVLSDYAEFAYKCTDFYHPNDEGGLKFDDPDIGVAWPFEKGTELIMSEKDTKWQGLRAYKEERNLS